MRIKILNILLLLVFTIGIFGAGSLVLNEISQHNICPKLIGVPACYIVLTCMIIPLFVYLLKRNNLVYFLFTGLAFVIALVATVMQLTGIGECPKTENGTPMCFYSLLLFLCLIVLKFYIKKNVSKNL